MSIKAACWWKSLQTNIKTFIKHLFTTYLLFTSESDFHVDKAQCILNMFQTTSSIAYMSERGLMDHITDTARLDTATSH